MTEKYLERQVREKIFVRLHKNYWLQKMKEKKEGKTQILKRKS